MAVTVRDNDKQWRDFVRGLEAISAAPKSVVTGIQEGATNEEGISVAGYAVANELGATIKHKHGATRIPSRPFMRLYFDNNRARIERFAENAITQAILGRATPQMAFNAIGVFTQAGIRKQILKSSDYTPNSPLTVKLKGSSKPLVDHSIMLNTVTFELRRE